MSKIQRAIDEVEEHFHDHLGDTNASIKAIRKQHLDSVSALKGSVRNLQSKVDSQYSKIADLQHQVEVLTETLGSKPSRFDPIKVFSMFTNYASEEAAPELTIVQKVDSILEHLGLVESEGTRKLVKAKKTKKGKK